MKFISLHMLFLALSFGVLGLALVAEAEPAHEDHVMEIIKKTLKRPLETY